MTTRKNRPIRRSAVVISARIRSPWSATTVRACSAKAALVMGSVSADASLAPLAASGLGGVEVERPRSELLAEEATVCDELVAVDAVDAIGDPTDLCRDEVELF